VGEGSSDVKKSRPCSIDTREKERKEKSAVIEKMPEWEGKKKKRAKHREKRNGSLPERERGGGRGRNEKIPPCEGKGGGIDRLCTS